MQEVKDYYDEVPYFSAAFPDCSPFRLEAIGLFLGLDAPNARGARVLELGCSYGGNILPFAAQNERAEVVGIDVSQVQVDRGNKIVSKTGVKNLKLLRRDILSLTDEDFARFGEFDYVIAHGLYSWVSGEVKDALLRAIRRLLARRGIAYVSYNVYPGWKSLDVLRDFMVFAAHDKSCAADRLNEARKQLEFLRGYLKFSLQTTENRVYKDTCALLLTQLNYVKKIMDEDNDYYVLHDFLEASNDPIYFYKFVEHARTHGLCYLSDCNLDDVFRQLSGVQRFDAHIEQSFASRVGKQQMRDFMLNRSFRKSLLMKREILGDAEDFDCEIGLNEIGRLNFILKEGAQNFNAADGEPGGDYMAEGGSAPSKEIAASENFSAERAEKKNSRGVLFALKSAYPSSLNLDEISRITGLDAAAAANELLEIFATKKCAICARPLKAVIYAKDALAIPKARLKPRVAGYLSYFASTEKPEISLADGLNFNADLSCDEARTALKFDGKNTLSQIILSLKKEGALNAEELVLSLNKKLTAAHFLEEI